MKMVQIAIKIFITLILGYGIFYVWTKEIDLKAIIQEPFNKIFHLKSKVEYPVFNAGLSNSSIKYKVGLEVNGIVWRKDFQEFEFRFNYSENRTELKDFKIDIQFPAGVVAYKVLKSSGFDNLNVYVNQDTLSLGTGNEIHKLIKYYPNHLFVNSLKIYPNSNLVIKIVLKPSLHDNNGFIKYNFDFVNEREQIIVNDWVYPMPFHLQDDFLYFTISKEFVLGKYDYCISKIPEEPIVFKDDGTIIQ